MANGFLRSTCPTQKIFLLLLDFLIALLCAAPTLGVLVYAWSIINQD